MPLGWRPDGDLVRDVPLTRRIMPYILRRRNEAIVFFEQKVDVTRIQEFLKQFRERTGLHATYLHLLIWGAAKTIKERPRLNRFTVGGRLFQRRGIWITYSGKKAKSDEHPLFVVKREINPDWTFEELVKQVEGGLKEGRSEKPSYTEKELSFFLRLPPFFLNLFVKFQMLLDELGLLPGFFYRNDPMYASAFIVNLGSIPMDAGFHHLYEYGNIPFFVLIGKVQNEVVAGEDGKPAVKPIITIRYSYDERVEDGFYCAKALELLKVRLENPDT